MIFSHVLYQLSYLAQTKNPPEPLWRGREAFGEGRTYRLSASAHLRGLHVSETIQNRILCILVSFQVPERGKRRLRAALLKQ